MPYIGKAPISGGFHKLDNLTASSTATYALTLGSAAYYPETANQLLVSLNGVIQAPQDSFTVSGSNLIFDSALTASDSIDFVVALGDVLGVQGVTDGAVSTNKIANGAVTMNKLATSGTLPALDGSALTNLPAASGSIVQVQSFNLVNVRLATSSSSFTATQLTVNITPASSSNKIYISVAGSGNNESAGRGLYWTLYRDGTDLGGGTSGLGQIYSAAGRVHGAVTVSIVDSPATTSQVTYTLYVRANGGTVEFPASTAETATITAMEIAG